MGSEMCIRDSLYTDCKSLFDHLKKEGAVPDDKWVAVPLGSLRSAVSAGPGRNLKKSECRWVPSRWQLADCLTKKGLAADFRQKLATGVTKLHELSLQAIKRKNKKKVNASAHLCNFVEVVHSREKERYIPLSKHIYKNLTFSVGIFFQALRNKPALQVVSIGFQVSSLWIFIMAQQRGRSSTARSSTDAQGSSTARRANSSFQGSSTARRVRVTAPVSDTCLLYTSPSPRDS